MKVKLKCAYNNFSVDISTNLPNIDNKEKSPPLYLVLLVGVIIGFINGLWGGGGGMVCVASLIHILKLPEKKAHATTILIILPLCIASLIIYLFKGAVNFSEGWPVLIGFVAGGTLGAMLLKKINNIVLMIIFTVLIIAGGIKMIL